MTESKKNKSQVGSDNEDFDKIVKSLLLIPPKKNKKIRERASKKEDKKPKGK